jgi:2-methylcitrate dehydratase PrpD
VLALSEEQDVGEEDLVTAFVAGSEVAYTLGDICTHNHYFQGWFSTATFGLVGATAAAARLLGLTTDQAAHAIGGAAASASGGRGVLGTEMKPYLVGEAAQRAIGFARAAQAGLTSPAEIFESAGGFFALLNKGLAEEAEAATIGQRWRLTNPGLLFKTSPVCSAAHAAIEQMVLLMNELSATADDIVSITAEIPELVGITLIHPFPNTPQEAQFSLPYALACAAVYGRVRLADLQPEEMITERIAAIMKKVTSDVAEDLSTEEMRNQYPESARLTVTLVDGRVKSGFCGEAYGMPKRPLSDEDIIKKFKECLQFAEVCVPDFSLMETNLLHLSSEILR